MSNIFGTNTTSNLMSVAETAQKIMQDNPLTEDWLEYEMRKVQYKWPRTNPKIKQQWLKKITARAEKDGMDMSAGGEFEDRLDDYELTIHAEDKVWTEASKIKSKWKKMSTAERTRWLDKIDDLARKQNTSDEDVRAIRDEFGLHMSEEVEVAENFAVLNEALKPRDKAVIDAFYSRKGNLASNLLSVEGGKLTKMGMGGQEIAIWKNDKIVINAKMDVKSTEEIVRYMKKSIPSGVFEEVEIAEGWKKGKYTIKDENGKILGTYSSGGKAKKVMDDLMQKGDYPDLTVSMVEEVEIEEKKSATGYELYHKTFSDAMQHAYAHAKSKGFVVDPKEIDDKVATGPKKPSSGKTNRYSLKAGRKKVEIQVANLDNKRYELNMYIEAVELEEAFSMGKGDKRVVDAFYDQKEIKAHGASILTTDGKTLTKRGMGGQDIAKWVNGKIKIVAVSDVKSTELILKYMKKSIPSGVFEEMGNVAPTAPDSGGIQYQEPVLGQKKKKKKQTIDEAVKRTTFAGKDVFIVDSETYYNCRLGKKKYARYEKYVGNGKVGQTIREYGLKYPRRPIILQNGESGPMLYLKYGRS